MNILKKGIEQVARTMRLELSLIFSLYSMIFLNRKVFAKMPGLKVSGRMSTRRQSFEKSILASLPVAYLC